MTNEEFTALVSRLEDRARRDPAGYRLRVLMLALAGNVYLAVILVLITALLVGLLACVVVLKALAVKLALVVGVFLWMLVKALWVQIPPPQGREIRAREAPELFAMIEGLRHELGAPRFHHVLITDDFNAGVVQSPRLGVFGWPRNYLLIGLPLMKSLSAQQFKAVLAHEFGHLAKGHGRTSNWIYRQRLRWSRLMDVLEAQHSRGRFLFIPFLKWYAPYFNAYSFPLARANEYEADATSAKLTSARTAAQALTSVSVIGSYLAERYWPQIHRQADEVPQPGFAPFSRMGQSVAADLEDATAQDLLAQALAEQTTVDDTHPALTDRLKALGETPHLVPPAPGEASDRLLGPALDTVTQAFDRRWRDSILPAWQEHHREVQEGRRRLTELDAQHQGGAELSLQAAYERATLTESIAHDPEAALAQWRTLHRRAPDDAVICYALGVRLLARDDDAGIPLVERAMALDEDATAQGCEVLRDHYWRHGHEAQAHTWHQRLVQRRGLLQAAELERNQVLLSDKLVRHDLSDEALAALCAQLTAIPGLRRAYFVKKRVVHFPERPCYVLGFAVGGMPGTPRQRRTAEVQKHIQTSVRFDAETMIISVEGRNYRFGRKLKWMRGSRIL